MPISLVLIACAGLILAGIIKGATGLGYATCALPFLVATLGLKPAMAVVLLPAIATNITVAATTGHFAESFRRFRPLYLAMLPGILIGVVALDRASGPAVFILGGIIITYAVFALAGPHFRLSDRAERVLMVPTGFTNGLVTGLTGSQVMPLFPYMMALDLDPQRLVQAINVAVLLASAILGAGLLATGIMTPTLLGASALALAPAGAGLAIGSWVRTRIPVALFRRLVLGVLIAMGLLLMFR